MTARLYAERKGWALDRVEAQVTRQPASGRMAAIDVELILGGDLDDDQRQRLHDIATRCPVSRALHEGIQITHH